MIIFPEKVSRDDADWMRTCALLQVLALDPRAKLSPESKPFADSAFDLLERPKIYVDGRPVRVPAPYYWYELHFDVSASVYGIIPIDDAEQLGEFRRAVTANLQGPLTTAERCRHTANRTRNRMKAAQDPETVETAEESTDAPRFYEAARTALEESYRIQPWRSMRASHAEILEKLVEMGMALLAGPALPLA